MNMYVSSWCSMQLRPMFLGSLAQFLVCLSLSAGPLHRLFSVPIGSTKEKVLGVLTMGFGWPDENQDLSV